MALLVVYWLHTCGFSFGTRLRLCPRVLSKTGHSCITSRSRAAIVQPIRSSVSKLQPRLPGTAYIICASFVLLFRAFYVYFHFLLAKDTHVPTDFLTPTTHMMSSFRPTTKERRRI
ncbi:hypothetical protein GBAR_LOCUS18829 [Geodia barretti]|uniref:Secreted protein n=1 Tax=Geodia barretti TaxID=519541 RepID=A0AA35SQE8_GEOBA|nr:hypothetical protein GBAR_LOCUS18829 [Geodia barretti]